MVLTINGDSLCSGDVMFPVRYGQNCRFNGRKIPFVNHVNYLDVIFNKRITWRMNIELTEAKAFRTFIRIYSVFESERLSASIKLTLLKALIRSEMTYACPAWELAADTYT
jgi:hypothetical protein